MATKITIALEDDLDGGPAGETVRFAVGGTEYEIDRNNKHAAAPREQLAHEDASVTPAQDDQGIAAALSPTRQPTG
jgi:hypothetical protein